MDISASHLDYYGALKAVWNQAVEKLVDSIIFFHHRNLFYVLFFFNSTEIEVNMINFFSRIVEMF